jgi:hypothetical protein
MPWSKMSKCVPGVVFYTREPCMRGNKGIWWTIGASYAGWSSCHPSREGWWKSSRVLTPLEGNIAVDFGGLRSHGSELPWLPWQHWPPCLQVSIKDLNTLTCASFLLYRIEQYSPHRLRHCDRLWNMERFAHRSQRPGHQLSCNQNMVQWRPI